MLARVQPRPTPRPIQASADASNEQYAVQLEEERVYEQVRIAVLHFEEMVDPRIEWSKQYPLLEVVVIALSAVLSEAESFYEIAEFGKTKQAWLKRLLALEHGTP